MANIALLLIADAFAKRRGETTGVALRAALAAALANRNAPVPAPPPPPAAPPPPAIIPQQPQVKKRLTSQGTKIMSAVGIPPAPNVRRAAPGFPSFLGYNATQAREWA